MLKAIKIRIYPNKEQINYINNMFGANRFLYNKCLEHKINEYKTNKKSTYLKDTSKYLTTYLKHEYPWMKETHSKVMQQILINLETAYKNFFKNNSGFPKFKSKNNKQSVRFPVDAISGFKGNRINIITKLKDINFKCSRKDEITLNKYKPKSATLSKTITGKYFLSVLIDTNEMKELKSPENLSVGIDIGVKTFIVSSKGQEYENLKFKSSQYKKIRKSQRELSRRVKGSKNREKSRIKLAKINERINNKKEYYLHSVVNQLLNDSQVIMIEDLNVSGMLKNHKLSKAIQEVSFYRFKEILKYKAEWYGRKVLEVDRWFPSSKLCSNCGYKNNELKLKDREWICPKCGSNNDRDLNAAINIRNEGLKIFNKKIGMSLPELMPLETQSID
jgi:putative transposase